MRDRNLLSYQQFNIQLEKYITSGLQEFGTGRNTFSQELSFEFRPGGLHPGPKIVYPKDFRLLRVLCIVQWYFPESLHFLTVVSLEEEEFSWLNFKQQVEIQIYLSSKENMEKYLYLTDRYSGNEIFGNILKNDLQDLSKKFRVSKEFYPRPRKKVFRRGPKDKGSRRVTSLGPIYEDDVRRDVFLALEDEEFQRKKRHRQSTINRILRIIANLSDL